MTSIMHFLPTCRGAQSSFLPVLGNTALKVAAPAEPSVDEVL